MKIGYMTGKGNSHLVPVLIPHDNVHAIKKIQNFMWKQDIEGNFSYILINTSIFYNVYNNVSFTGLIIEILKGYEVKSGNM